MKATKTNIGGVLRTNARGLNWTKAPKGNGWVVKGFLSRYAIMDLMSNFHCYLNKIGGLVILTPGMLDTKDRLD